MDMHMDWNAYLDVATRLHDLPLDPAHRDEVIERLKRSEALALAALDFDLPAGNAYGVRDTP